VQCENPQETRAGACERSTVRKGR